MVLVAVGLVLMRDECGYLFFEHVVFKFELIDEVHVIDLWRLWDATGMLLAASGW